MRINSIKEIVGSLSVMSAIGEMLYKKKWGWRVRLDGTEGKEKKTRRGNWEMTMKV